MPSRSRGVLLAVQLLLAGIPCLLAQSGRGPIIPAISGTVVDALTGKPVPSIDVILRASLLIGSFGDGGAEPLRYATARSSPEGSFRFPSTVEPKAAGLLAGISELSLSATRAFPLPNQIQGGNPSERGRASDGGSDVTWLAKQGTLPDADAKFNPSNGHLNNKSYFPMSVQFLRDCRVLACISHA